MELGHWVTGSMGHLGHLSRPGHRVIILTRVRPEFFRFFKMPKIQNVHLKRWNDKSHCQVSVVGLKSLDVSACSELLLLPMTVKNSSAWEYFFTRKSTFGVHYTTGSPGQLGLRVAGFPGHWVAGSQNVTQFHLCLTLAICSRRRSSSDHSMTLPARVATCLLSQSRTGVRAGAPSRRRLEGINPGKLSEFYMWFCAFSCNLLAVICRPPDPVHL